MARVTPSDNKSGSHGKQTLISTNTSLVGTPVLGLYLEVYTSSSFSSYNRQLDSQSVGNIDSMDRTFESFVHGKLYPVVHPISGKKLHASRGKMPFLSQLYIFPVPINHACAFSWAINHNSMRQSYAFNIYTLLPSAFASYPFTCRLRCLLDVYTWGRGSC